MLKTIVVVAASISLGLGALPSATAEVGSVTELQVGELQARLAALTEGVEVGVPPVVGAPQAPLPSDVTLPEPAAQAAAPVAALLNPVLQSVQPAARDVALPAPEQLPGGGQVPNINVDIERCPLVPGTPSPVPLNIQDDHNVESQSVNATTPAVFVPATSVGLGPFTVPPVTIDIAGIVHASLGGGDQSKTVTVGPVNLPSQTHTVTTPSVHVGDHICQ